jgi:hypothetical protein
MHFKKQDEPYKCNEVKNKETILGVIKILAKQKIFTLSTNL